MCGLSLEVYTCEGSISVVRLQCGGGHAYHMFIRQSMLIVSCPGTWRSTGNTASGKRILVLVRLRIVLTYSSSWCRPSGGAAFEQSEPVRERFRTVNWSPQTPILRGM